MKRPLQYEINDVRTLLEPSGISRAGMDRLLTDLVEAVRAEERAVQAARQESLGAVLTEAAGVFLVGIPPEHREAAREALNGFLVRACKIGQRLASGDGR